MPGCVQTAEGSPLPAETASGNVWSGAEGGSSDGGAGNIGGGGECEGTAHGNPYGEDNTSVPVLHLPGYSAIRRRPTISG